MAMYKAQKTDMHGVFRIVSSSGRPGVARILVAAFSEFRDAEEWAKAYAKEHFDCEMAVDLIDVKIRAWDGTTSSMTLLK